MKSSYAIFRALMVLVCWAMVTQARIFENISRQSVFATCLRALQRSQRLPLRKKVEPSSFASICADEFFGAQAMPTALQMKLPQKPGPSYGEFDACAEFAGRAKEAKEQGYLGDGLLLCGRLVREDAAETRQPVSAYLPSEDSAAIASFCSAMQPEAPMQCALLAKVDRVVPVKRKPAVGAHLGVDAAAPTMASRASSLWSRFLALWHSVL